MREENSCLLWVFIFAILALACLGCSKPDVPYYDKEEYCECTEVYVTHEYKYEGNCRKENGLDQGFIEFKYNCFE